MDFIYLFQYQFAILRDEEETEQFPIHIFTQLCTLDYTKISAARDLSHFLIEISRSHFPRSPLMYLYWYLSHCLIEISRSLLTFNVFVFVFVPLLNRNLKVSFSTLDFNVFVLAFVQRFDRNRRVSFSLLTLNVFVFVFEFKFVVKGLLLSHIPCFCKRVSHFILEISTSSFSWLTFVVFVFVIAI